MADWTRAKLGDVVERSGEWWRTIVVPVSGPEEDPRAAADGSQIGDTWHIIPGASLETPPDPRPGSELRITGQEVDEDGRVILHIGGAGEADQ